MLQILPSIRIKRSYHDGSSNASKKSSLDWNSSQLYSNVYDAKSRDIIGSVDGLPHLCGGKNTEFTALTHRYMKVTTCFIM